MGMSLAFMLVWNMVGALILLPALARFLLPAAAGTARHFVIRLPPPDEP
jgi:hypothetical protein